VGTSLKEARVRDSSPLDESVYLVGGDILETLDLSRRPSHLNQIDLRRRPPARNESADRFVKDSSPGPHFVELSDCSV